MYVVPKGKLSANLEIEVKSFGVSCQQVHEMVASTGLKAN